jgi:hypothetical protein
MYRKIATLEQEDCVVVAIVGGEGARQGRGGEVRQQRGYSNYKVDIKLDGM